MRKGRKRKDCKINMITYSYVDRLYTVHPKVRIDTRTKSIVNPATRQQLQ